MTTQKRRASSTTSTRDTIAVAPAHELAFRDGFPSLKGGAKSATLPAELARELIAKGAAVKVGKPTAEG